MALSETLGYTHTQTTASTIWTVIHNLNTQAPIIDCWVDVSGTITKIIPVSVVVVNSYTVTVTFSTSRSGYAYVA